MDANLPPWLESRNTDTRDSLLGGMRLGDQMAQLKLQASESQARQQMGFMELAQRKQEFDKEFQLKTAEMSVQTEMRRETIKNQAVAIAQKYQTDRAFQSKMDELVGSGMPYEQAYLQASMLTGANKPDLAAHFASVSRENVAETAADAKRDTAQTKPPIDEKEVRTIWADTYKSTGSTEEANKAVSEYRRTFGGAEGGTVGNDSGNKPATERYKIVTAENPTANADAAATESPASEPATLPKAMAGIPAPIETQASSAGQRAHPKDERTLLLEDIRSATEDLNNAKASRAGQSSRQYREAYQKLLQLHQQLEALP